MSVRIPIVQESEATGELKALYDEASEVFGFVPDILKLVSTRPDFLRPMLEQYKAMFLQGTLPRPVKEMVATVVSQANSCDY